MSAFFSSISTINIGPQETKTVDIHFLPFSVGDRQCSVIFLNESIGEFLYSIEAKSTLPLPAPIPFVKSQYSVRITSAAAAGELDHFIFYYYLPLWPALYASVAFGFTRVSMYVKYSVSTQ